MKRSSGVLLNISSLAGDYGIGGFSYDAKSFVEYLASAGFHWWQILPLTTVGLGNSPYSGVSAFAGNFLYVDASSFEEGLLTDEEKEQAKYRGDIFLVNYGHAYWAKRFLLECAIKRLDDEKKTRVAAFSKENEYWLKDYCLYMTLKEMHDYRSWFEWEDRYKFRDADALSRIAEEKADRIFYYQYEQYEFFRQWNGLKQYANDYGIEIFGDMPIYVCHDSVDVWANPKLFQLDADRKPVKVSGVPPDYFAKDGQLWNNPLYDYDYMKKDGYSWWIARIKHNLKLYDLLRIDHFRGFFKYWAVPAGSETAKNGEWVDGPVNDIWDELRKAIPNPPIVAEDLGIIDEDIRKYVDDNGFYGMRVLQFGFDGDPKNHHLPHNYTAKSVAYTSTHDNDTTLGWMLSLDDRTRNRVFDYINCDGSFGWASGGGSCRATKAFIRTVIGSPADLAIISMQDLCGYGSDTRMNVPGKAEGNWLYRTNYSAVDNVDVNYMRKLNEVYGRS